MLRTLAAIALLLLPATAQAAWQEASSKHFVVYADDTPARLQAFTTMLERADKAMRVLRGISEPAVSPMSRVTVFVVRDVGAIHRLYGKGGGDVAGFYDPRASGSVAFVPRRSGGAGEFDLNATQVLLHEYAHHFMYANSPNAVYPGWLVEGFAEFNATIKVADNGDVTVGEPPMYRAYGIVNNTLPLRTILTAEPQSLPTDDRDMFYGRGWLLTHYLTMDKDRRVLLTQYMAALNKGESPLDAAKTLGSLATLDRQLGAYTRARLSVFKIPAAMVPIDPVTVRALSPGEAAVMPARIASNRGVDAKTAPGVATQARALAAPFTTDAAAQNVLAEAEFDTGNYAAAQAAAERALVADPKSIHAMMYQGLARMAAARKAGTTDLKTWEAARTWFRRANRADPEYAWPLELYYASFAAAKMQPTKNAEDGLLYARELAPFDAGLGMTAAYVDLKRDDAKEATRVLEPIAYNPHGGGAATMAQAMLDVMRKDGAKAALAALDKAQQEAEAKAEGTAATPSSIVSPRARRGRSVPAR